MSLLCFCMGESPICVFNATSRPTPMLLHLISCCCLEEFLGGVLPKSSSIQKHMC